MAWRRSSKCDSQNCVEVDFRESSYCSDGTCIQVGYKRSSKCDTGACVQVGYKKSSFCDARDCVEVGKHENMVLVRDSKQVNQVGEAGPYDVLMFSAGDWRQFLADVPVRSRG